MPRRSAATTRIQRDWEKERESFLSRIAPGSHFQIVFDSLVDVVFFVKNLAGEIIFFSRGALPHHGLRHDDDLLGATDDELTPGPLADHYKEQDQRVIQTRKPLLRVIDVWLDEVGLPDWYETSKYPIFDRRGEVIGVMGTLRGCQGNPLPGTMAARIGPAVTLLQAELDRFPPIHRLARACGLSPRQLQRYFHDTFVCSPRTFWMRCRIRSACIALRDGHESVSAISQRLGFCDQSNFTRHFRQHTGTTPAAYLKRVGTLQSRSAR